MRQQIQFGISYTNRKELFMTQIQKIDYLILEYEKGKYSTETFCDEFVITLYHEKDDSISQDLFNTLDVYACVFSRFSPYEEDVKSGVLFGEGKVKKEFQKLSAIWHRQKATKGDVGNCK